SGPLLRLREGARDGAEYRRRRPAAVQDESAPGAGRSARAPRPRPDRAWQRDEARGRDARGEQPVGLLPVPYPSAGGRPPSATPDVRDWRLRHILAMMPDAAAGRGRDRPFRNERKSTRLN